MEVIKSSQADGKLLCHTMSNGGGLQMCNLIKAAQKSSTKAPALQAKLLVFDSCPGAVSFKVFLQAFSVPFSKSLAIVRYAVKSAFTFYYFTTAMVASILRWQDPVTIMRKTFVSPQSFPREANRLFIYSKEDELIAWQNVEDHMAQCREAGSRVQGELYTSPQ